MVLSLLLTSCKNDVDEVPASSSGTTGASYYITEGDRNIRIINAQRMVVEGESALSFSDLFCPYDKDGNVVAETRVLYPGYLQVITFKEKASGVFTIKRTEQGNTSTGTITVSSDGITCIMDETYVYKLSKDWKLLEIEDDYGVSTFEYDANGYCIEEHYHEEYHSEDYDDVYDCRYTFKYDGNGNCIEVALYGGDGTLIWRQTYEYDKKGNITKFCYYNSENTLVNYCIAECDASGFYTKEIWYNSNNQMTGYCEYEYDGNHYCTKKSIYECSGKLAYYYVYKYSKNKGTEECFDADGNPYDPYDK